MVKSFRPIQFARILACVILFALLPLKNANASGIIKAESNGFLRRSEDRADSSSTIAVGPRIDNQGKYVEGKLDLDAIIQVSDTKQLTIDHSAFTLEASNAYIATSKKLMNRHQVTVGRRDYDWSKFDKEWELGAVSPRFIWDPTRPQSVGMTGIFHSYESKHWRVLSHASPLSIPERGYPVRNENGNLSSSNAFYVPTFENAVIAKQNFAIKYNVEYPPMNELLMNAGGITSVRWSSEESGKGFWVQSLYGFTPIYQPNIAVLPQLVPQKGVIDVRISPAVQRHHLLSFETGVNRNNFSLWSSVTNEIPTERTLQPDWSAPNTEAAMIYSAGGSVRVGRWSLKSSYLLVDEKTPETIEEKDFTIELPSRFSFRRAVRADLEFQSNGRMNYALGLVNDLAFDSQLISFDMTYTLIKHETALTLNLGSDFFASSTSKGYIGQYMGNDRFRGGVSYAF